MWVGVWDHYPGCMKFLVIALLPIPKRLNKGAFHSMRTQHSDVYDLRTHIRDCEETFKWCYEYANTPLQIDDVAAEEHNAGAPPEKRQRIDQGNSDSDETVTD